jgi:hypothetical protein
MIIYDRRFLNFIRFTRVSWGICYLAPRNRKNGCLINMRVYHGGFVDLLSRVFLRFIICLRVVFGRYGINVKLKGRFWRVFLKLRYFMMRTWKMEWYQYCWKCIGRGCRVIQMMQFYPWLSGVNWFLWVYHLILISIVISWY